MPGHAWEGGKNRRKDIANNIVTRTGTQQPFLFSSGMGGRVWLLWDLVLCNRRFIGLRCHSGPGRKSDSCRSASHLPGAAALPVGSLLPLAGHMDPGGHLSRPPLPACFALPCHTSGGTPFAGRAAFCMTNSARATWRDTASPPTHHLLDCHSAGLGTETPGILFGKDAAGSLPTFGGPWDHACTPGEQENLAPSTFCALLTPTTLPTHTAHSCTPGAYL